MAALASQWTISKQAAAQGQTFPADELVGVHNDDVNPLVQDGSRAQNHAIGSHSNILSHELKMGRMWVQIRSAIHLDGGHVQSDDRFRAPMNFLRDYAIQAFQQQIVEDK